MNYTNSEKECPYCHAAFTASAIYCPNCGKQIQSESNNLHRNTRRTVLLRQTRNTEQTGVWLEYNGNKYPINSDLYHIGADVETCSMVIDEDVISLNHADIVSYGNKFYVIDLSSENGTYLNGLELPSEREVQLKDGDNLTLANIDISFHCTNQ